MALPDGLDGSDKAMIERYQIERKLWDERLDLILDIGEQMMLSGAEVSRVEDSVNRLCMAFGADHAEVLSITTSLIVTVYMKEYGSITQTRRTMHYVSDMNRLDKMNALSRHICEKHLSLREARKEYDSIMKEKPYSFPMRLVFYIIVAFSFALFFGGDFFDATASGIIAILFCIFDKIAGKLKLNSFLSILIMSLAGGFLASLSVEIGFAHSIAKVSIGDVMILIPGIILTNSMRDMFGGDTITGGIHFLEAMLTAATIAFGFTTSRIFFNDLIGHTVISTGRDWPVWAGRLTEVITAFFGSFGYASLFNVRGSRIIPAGIGGSFGWIIYLIAAAFISNDPVRYFFAAIAITFYAEFMARRKKAPATIFLVSAVMPLVPGGSLYESMTYGVQREWSSFGETGLKTIVIALALAVGMLVTSGIRPLLKH